MKLKELVVSLREDYGVDKERIHQEVFKSLVGNFVLAEESKSELKEDIRNSVPEGLTLSEYIDLLIMYEEMDV